MFLLYFCLQFSLSVGTKRPNIVDSPNDGEIEDLPSDIPSTQQQPPNTDDYQPHEPIRETEINIDVKKCAFNNLDNSADNGGAILITTKKKVNCTINDCKFNQCTAKYGGAIYAYYSSESDYEFSIIDSIFTGCYSQKNGGALFLQSSQPLHHTFNITGCTFDNNKGVSGGAIYAELRDQLTLENCQFNNNEASNKGSSAYLKLGHENIKNGVEEHDTFKIHNNIFIFNPTSNNTVNLYIENDRITDSNDPAHVNVYFGGCIFQISTQTPSTDDYLHLEVVENQGFFESFNFDSCNCVHQEQSTVKIASNLNFINFNFGCTSIDTCTPNIITPTPPPTPDADGYTPHDPIREVSLNIDIEKCTFNKLDNLDGEGGAILITYQKKVSCKVNDCKFIECKGRNGGAICTYYSTTTSYQFIVINSIFNACESTYSGGAIYLQSAQPTKHQFNITQCTFNNNKASKGGALYAELRDQLILEGCQFNNNEASNKGSSAYFKLGHENIKNSVEEHDTFNIHNNVFIFNPNLNNTVNVYIENDKITDITDPAHANVNFGGCTFSLENSTPSTNDYLHLEIVENAGGFESFTFDSCNCVHQEERTVSISTISNVSFNVRLYNFNFGCTSIDSCTSDQPIIVPSTQTQQPTTPDAGDYEQHEPIRETEINIDIKKCLFNALDYSEGNGGAILITTKKKVNCTITNCKFNECKAKSGGAIFAFYSAAVDYEFSIINSIFTACECETRGGAVYIQSAQPLHHTFNITGCTFSGNKAVYGGALYAELRDQLTLENCQFNNNEASNKGSSAYLKLGHENIKNNVEEHDTFKIHNNIFIFNPNSNNTVNVFIENDEITDTNDPAHANVYLGGCTFSLANPTPSTNNYLHLEIVENVGGFESFTFDSCNCVNQAENSVKVASSVRIFNFKFGCSSIDSCTSDQPSYNPTEPPTPDAEGYTQHDPIRETTTTIDITKSKFNSLSNLGKNGGAILITFAKKVNCKINNCKFNECKANNGGAIAASYSTTADYEFKISQTSFSGCEADTRGGSIYVTSAQPLHHKFDITGCTFSGNKAVYGGALYAELRDQLTLENCQFNNNEASNKGSSAYLKLGHENIKNNVEEHDTFKIHNNIFIFNPNSNNTVNVFIENDEITDTNDPAHANVYLGGCTFSLANSRNAKSESTNEYLHLEIVENYGGFETFTFDSCNCVNQAENTVKVASTIKLNNFNFGCTSIDKCTPSGGEPTNPSSSSSSSSSSQISLSSSSSLVDKDIDNESSMSNKSKVGLIVGVAAAAVVVVVIIVIVVLLIVRKTLTGNDVHDIKTDDIAENLNPPASADL